PVGVSAVAQVTAYLFPSRAAVIADIAGRLKSACRRPSAPRDSQNGCYGTLDRVTASVRLDVEGPDHLAPLFGFLGDQLAEVSGRTRKHRAAEVSEMGLHLRVVESRVDLLVELLDDLGRRVLGYADAIPVAGLITRYEFRDGWNIRQRLRPRRGRDAQGAYLAGFDVFDRGRRRSEIDLHLSANQVGEGRPRAAIRYIHHVDASHHFKQLTRDIRRPAGAD